jgi:hypothetical protein
MRTCETVAVGEIGTEEAAICEHRVGECEAEDAHTSADHRAQLIHHLAIGHLKEAKRHEIQGPRTTHFECVPATRDTTRAQCFSLRAHFA